MDHKTNEYHLAYPLKTFAKFIGRLFYFFGRPLYLLLESSLLLSLIIFYQIGQLIIRRIPFLSVFLFLGGKLIFLKLRSYLAKRKLHLISPLALTQKISSRLSLLPILLRRLTERAQAQLPGKPPITPVQVGRRAKIVGAGVFIIGAVVFSFWYFIIHDLPNPEDLRKPRPLTTHIYDRSGTLLFKIYRSENRTILPLSSIPLHVQQATIAIEDAEFYTHPGFSLRGIARALQRNILQGELVGGSTITQQLVKNTLLTNEKTLRRKIKEILLALLTETKFSKSEILAMYLNNVSYGGAAYGIEEAAQLYFRKSAKDVTLAEATLLAGLPAAPTRFSPFGANPELSKARQNLVLSRMLEEDFITKEQREEATKTPPVFAPQRAEIRAPHFVMFVRQILAETYGERMVEEGGLNVITSLDLGTQEAVEKIVREEVAHLAPLRVGNGAALVTNPSTGEVVAMVGSADYFDTKKEGNFNVTTALRQPGSSIKPVNYAWALSHGYTPATILEDSPVTYNIPSQPPYSPANYDRTFRGKIPLRVALGSSLNVPAVKVLASYGVLNMIEQGKKMGITTWNDLSRFGLSLTLGGGEVKMTDMAVVYATLANYGKKVELRPILKVTDSSGRVLEENGCDRKFTIYNLQFTIPFAHAAVAQNPFNCEGEQVLDERVAFLLTDILRDNRARTPVFGPSSLLVIPGHQDTAVKTGTTQNLRDNWAIGYTKDFVVVSWVGNNDNTPMSWVASGVTGATPIWYKTMNSLLQETPNHNWEAPEGLVKVPICPLTGTLPCEGCPTIEEWFLAENQPKIQCNLEQKFDF